MDRYIYIKDKKVDLSKVKEVEMRVYTSSKLVELYVNKRLISNYYTEQEADRDCMEISNKAREYQESLKITNSSIQK